MLFLYPCFAFCQFAFADVGCDADVSVSGSNRSALCSMLFSKGFHVAFAIVFVEVVF